MMRSSEKAKAESTLIETILRDLIQDFKRTGAWERLQCVELIFVLGWANKDVAIRLNLTVQAVANLKFFVVQKLKDAAKSAKLQNSALSGLGLEESARRRKQTLGQDSFCVVVTGGLAPFRYFV